MLCKTKRVKSFHFVTQNGDWCQWDKHKFDDENANYQIFQLHQPISCNVKHTATIHLLSMFLIWSDYDFVQNEACQIINLLSHQTNRVTATRHPLSITILCKIKHAKSFHLVSHKTNRVSETSTNLMKCKSVIPPIFMQCKTPLITDTDTQTSNTIQMCNVAL